MKRIGEWLKSRRIELGFSLEDIEKRTRISPVHLKAIEEGDLAYFKEDMSYLKFFIQYYCQAVYYDYSEIEAELNDLINQFNQTELLQVQELREQSNLNIQQRINLNKQQKAKLRINWPSLIIMIGVILFCLILLILFLKMVFPALKPTEEAAKTPQIIEPLPLEGMSKEKSLPDKKEAVVLSEKENDAVTAKDTTDQETTEAVAASLIKLDAYNYEVDFGSTETAKLKVLFKRETWISVSNDGILSESPQSRIYAPNETIEIVMHPDEYQKITLVMGIMLDNEFYLNDERIRLDEAISQDTGGTTINFIFKGETLHE